MIPKGPQRVGQRLAERLAELKTGYTVGLRPRRSLSAATGHAFRGADRCCLTAIASAPAGRTPIPRPLAPAPLSAPPIRNPFAPQLESQKNPVSLGKSRP